MANDKLSSFIEQLSTSIAGTVQQLTGASAKASISPEGAEEATHPEIWCVAALQMKSECRLALGCDRITGLFLARAMISETPNESASWTAEDDELIAEFGKQAVGRLSDDLSDFLQNEKFDYRGSVHDAWPVATFAKLTLQLPNRSLNFVLQLSMEMVRRLSKLEDLQAIATQISTGAKTSDHGAISSDNLDLLLDVPLAVTLRFGQRRMPLREILQLASGSVVELDRQADDAVDLLLDERIIARGQVVVVDGCYGLRVTEVCR
ncbi:MAG TPA: flagellar motor switch protein FliN [Terriglobales bacterium]|nr:flagellar motor switch protein FliN [Terriglobales bacterium]